MNKKNIIGEIDFALSSLEMTGEMRMHLLKMKVELENTNSSQETIKIIIEFGQIVLTAGQTIYEIFQNT